MRHKLLARQMRRALGVNSDKALQARLDALRGRGEAAVADGLASLFDAVDQGYQQFERDLMVRTRMLEISSEELTNANDQLRSEAARQREVLESLRNTVQRLTAGTLDTPDASATAGFDDDLLRLTHALEALVQQREAARAALMVSEERLNQALKATTSRLWDWDLAQPQPYVDPAWMRYLGHDTDGMDMHGIAWDKQLHPDDLAAWRGHLREHLRGQRPELDIELRFITAAGDWRYASLRGKVVAWEGSKALRLAGMLQDISPRKQAEAAAQRQQELTEQILDQLPIAVFLKDREGRFLRFNRQFEQLSQRRREDILGHRVEDFASEGWAAVSLKEDAQAWSSGTMVTSERRLNNVNPPLDLLVNRIVISSGWESYLLGFSIDISEQRAARDAMQRAVESAEAASRAKSEFLANMSHEIRTPMNGILGMTELVLESRLTEQQREDIGLVKASADALLTIINDILDFSKIEAGKLDIEEVPFDLRRLVTETARSMALRAQQKSLELVCELPPDLPRAVKGDPGRLRQVLINLLANAIKFTQHGRIVLAARRGAEHADRCEIGFSVQDTGIGIPPEKQKLIFEAFSQVDGSTTRQFGGTGLGLTICRRLVILMQGQMAVESEPGVGSTFRFTVPLGMTGVSLEAARPLSWLAGKPVLLADADPASRAAIAAMLGEAGLVVSECASADQAHARLAQGPRPELIVLDGGMPDIDAFAAARLPERPPLLLVTSIRGARVDSLRFEPDARVSRPLTCTALAEHVLALLVQAADEPLVKVSGPEPALPAAVAPATPAAHAGQLGLRILLAEDNPVNQRLALRLLEKMGHRVTLVDNGLAALEAATRDAFDAILMDVQMPGLDGLAATRHIRQHETASGEHVPIIAMTARAMQGDRERCLEAGMDDYLSKPIDSGRLRQMLAQFDADAGDAVLSWRSALLRLDGDTELLLELAGIFLQDGPALLTELNGALAEDDAERCKRAVHSLKGVLVNFGAQRAIAHTERLSASLAQTTQREQWQVVADQLAPALEEVYGALRRLIAAGPDAMQAA